MKTRTTWRACLLWMAGLALAGSALAAGPRVGIQDESAESAKAPEGPPAVRVVEVVGSPTVVRADGAKETLEAGAALAPGDTIETDQSGRVAVSFGINDKAPPTRRDVLLVGSNSRVGIAGPLPDDKDAAPITVLVHRGAYQLSIRNTTGEALFVVKTGDRLMRPRYAAMIGTYEPTGDVGTYIVLARKIVIEAGRRKLRVNAGTVRVVEGGKIRGSKGVTAEQREFAIGLTRMAGVDLSQPPHPDDVAGEVRDVPKRTTPEAWEYDAKTNQYWDPSHNHWHSGRPPADRVSRPHGQPATADPAATDKPNTIVGDKPARPGTGAAGLGTRPPGQDPVKPDDPKADPAGAGAEAGGLVEAGNLQYVIVRTTKGNFILELDTDKAPATVKNFTDYVDQGFYSGTTFHRVISNFMIQGGGFTAGMQKKPVTTTVRNEWKNGLKNVRGSIAMARVGGQPDSASSQFFINVKDNLNLDQPQRDGAAYCVFGRVYKGMTVVEAIRVVPVSAYSQSHRHVPNEPVLIHKVERITAEEAKSATE